MAKIVITTQNNGQRIIHSSDGKDQQLPVSAGIAVTSVKAGVQIVHGQVSSTTVILDNPA